MLFSFDIKDRGVNLLLTWFIYSIPTKDFCIRIDQLLEGKRYEKSYSEPKLWEAI